MHLGNEQKIAQKHHAPSPSHIPFPFIAHKNNNKPAKRWSHLHSRVLRAAQTHTQTCMQASLPNLSQGQHARERAISCKWVRGWQVWRDGSSWKGEERGGCNFCQYLRKILSAAAVSRQICNKKSQDVKSRKCDANLSTSVRAALQAVCVCVTFTKFAEIRDTQSVFIPRD